jgi:hypothetical protein
MMIADLNEFGAFDDDMYSGTINLDPSKPSEEYIDHPVRTNGEILKHFDFRTFDYFLDGVTWKKAYDNDEGCGWQYDIIQDVYRCPGIKYGGAYNYYKLEKQGKKHTLEKYDDQFTNDWVKMPSKVLWGCKKSFLLKDVLNTYYTTKKYLKNRRIWNYTKNVVKNTIQHRYWEYAGVKIMFSRVGVKAKDGGNNVSIIGFGDDGKPMICSTLMFCREECTNEEYQKQYAEKIGDSWYYNGEMIDEGELTKQTITYGLEDLERLPL